MLRDVDIIFSDAYINLIPFPEEILLSDIYLIENLLSTKLDLSSGTVKAVDSSCQKSLETFAFPNREVNEMPKETIYLDGGDMMQSLSKDSNDISLNESPPTTNDCFENTASLNNPIGGERCSGYFYGGTSNLDRLKSNICSQASGCGFQSVNSQLDINHSQDCEQRLKERLSCNESIEMLNIDPFTQCTNDTNPFPETLVERMEQRLNCENDQIAGSVRREHLALEPLNMTVKQKNQKSSYSSCLSSVDVFDVNESGEQGAHHEERILQVNFVTLRATKRKSLISALTR